MSLLLRLSVSERTNFVTIGKDRLTATYYGAGHHSHDVGAVRADAAFGEAAGTSVHYYEVEILSVGQRNSIAVGMASQPSLMRHPGDERNSFGYHGSDGRLHADGGVRHEQYGPQFRAGDVIGCGVQLERGAVFFTRNGVLLPVVPMPLASPLVALVGLHSAGEAVRFNFGGGGALPFRFNLADMVRSLELSQAALVASMPVPDASVRLLIRHHLLFSAHIHSLRAFEAALPPAAVADDALSASAAAALPGALAVPSFAQLRATLETRAAVRGAIASGDVEAGALTLLATHWPALLEQQTFQAELQQLRFQVFIERLRRGDLLGAVAYARSDLAVYRGGADLAASLRVQCSEEYVAPLATVLGLLAYSDGAASPLSALYSVERRQWLARCVNERIVSHTVGIAASASALEVAQRHEHALTTARRQSKSQ